MAGIKNSKKIMIVAGEASGDLHGSALIRQMKEINGSFEFTGIGGKNMADAGQEQLYTVSDMAFLGFTEVIKHIPFLRKVRKRLLEKIEAENIDTVVLIDYPGFNLNLAKKLNKAGVNVLYYISPQVWAWAKGRVKKIRKLVDKMLVIFPFEEEFYKSEGVDVVYVGHPLTERINKYEFPEREKFFDTLDLDKTRDILLLMPGSRKQEVTKILPEALKAAEILAEKYNMQVIIARAGHIDESFYSELTARYNFRVIEGYTYELLKYAKYGIIKSGTSTLEAAYMGLPFVVVYVTNKLTYKIGKSLIRIANIALANIVAGKTIVPELIQDDVNAPRIVNEADALLSDSKRYTEMKNQLSVVKERLGETRAASTAAKVIADYTEGRK